MCLVLSEISIVKAKRNVNAQGVDAWCWLVWFQKLKVSVTKWVLLYGGFKDGFEGG